MKMVVSEEENFWRYCHLVLICFHHPDQDCSGCKLKTEGWLQPAWWWQMTDDCDGLPASYPPPAFMGTWLGWRPCMCQIYLWQGVRMSLGTSPADPWKWKWSNGVGKSEISLIWCISTTNKVKSCKKFNETASCEYRPKWTKTMQTQTRRIRLQNFLRGIQTCHMKADVLAIPKMWWFFIL